MKMTLGVSFTADGRTDKEVKTKCKKIMSDLSALTIVQIFKYQHRSQKLTEQWQINTNSLLPMSDLVINHGARVKDHIMINGVFFAVDRWQMQQLNFFSPEISLMLANNVLLGCTTVLLIIICPAWTFWQFQLKAC